MALTPQDITRIASLARLELDAAAQQQMLVQLNSFFSVVDAMQAVDTTGVVPLAHPVDVIAPQSLRLREDAPVHAPQQREALMANAPAAEDGFFLVPKVIE